MGLNDSLVSTEWLEQHLDDPTVVILEISIDQRAETKYNSGHVPGSHFV